MALTRRLVKGQALTSAEHDANIDYFEDNPNGIMIPKSSSTGIKIDEAAPDWGWHDLIGEVTFHEGDADTPNYSAYQGNIKQRDFAVNDTCQASFHIPHDYAIGTDLFIHTHWSHNSALVTTGSVTWQAEIMYAKGHNQAFFSTPIIVNMTENASTTRYQHMLVESQLSAAAGAGGLLVTGDIEPDGILVVQVTMTANSMDGGATPFIHACDIHYQSTDVPTKQKAPNFYV